MNGRLRKVLVVESDPVTANVYRDAIARLGPFCVIATASSGQDALVRLAREEVDLMLLDLTLGGMDGLTLLHRLRVAGHAVEVIVVSATNDARSVQAAVQRGAIDYIVKPFSLERLRQSLSWYLQRAGAMKQERLDQQAVDVICASGRTARRWLPKGLSQDGVARVREALTSLPTTALSAGDVALRTGLARVTARRYLEYLVATGQAAVDAQPAGPGRPTKLYRPEDILVADGRMSS